MSEKLVIIKTIKDLRALEKYLEDKDFIAFDTETTGLTKGSSIIGFSVAAETDRGYYVILSYWDVETQAIIKTEAHDAAESFLARLVPKNLIMHNASFDCRMVQDNFNIDLMPSVHTDTLLLGHLLNENRSNGLKERGIELFGEDARREQIEMKESVYKNGGQLTKKSYELYKADADLIAKYGAKDAVLTLKVFYNDIEILVEEGLEDFFYEEETMPLLRGPTYDMIRTGLQIDAKNLQLLKQELETDCMERKGFIYNEIQPHIKEKYSGTSKAKTFNIGASSQLAWLLFFQLNQEFKNLTKEGLVLCKSLDLKPPYHKGAKQEFIRIVLESKNQTYITQYNHTTNTPGKAKKVRDPWYYIGCGKEALGLYSKKYKWVQALLEYKKDLKLLNTYVEGIQERMQYNVIRPDFLQHGTTSGRYSCRNPNFQNLPREDKRVKSCIVARSGMVFVGADYAQLEPRVFASVSQDPTLLKCFKDGDDFYSVIGASVFNKTDCTLKKDDSPNSFPVKYKELRNVAKVIALATPYGTTPYQMARQMDKPIEECRETIDNYFQAYPEVERMMLDSHNKAKSDGVVYNLFGRPRRMPEAKNIRDIPHAELPYEDRNTLNLAMNHRVQSTAASVMNRAAIAVWKSFKQLSIEDPAWSEAKIILQVHDELILEVPEELAQYASDILKYCMENTTQLPGVDLIADPKIAKNLKDLK